MLGPLSYHAGGVLNLLLSKLLLVRKSFHARLMLGVGMFHLLALKSALSLAREFQVGKLLRLRFVFRIELQTRANLDGIIVHLLEFVGGLIAAVNHLVDAIADAP